MAELALKNSVEGKQIYIFKEKEDINFEIVIDNLNGLNINYKIIDNKRQLKILNNKKKIINYLNSELTPNNLNSFNIIY